MYLMQANLSDARIASIIIRLVAISIMSSLVIFISALTENGRRRIRISELKICPFCGQNPKMEHIYYRKIMLHIWYVKCENCGAEMNNPRQTEEEAIIDWNERDLLIRIGEQKKSRSGGLFRGGFLYPNLKGVKG